jgi:2'-5' RNA ligase
MRLFLAIFPPKEITDSLVEVQTKLHTFDKYLRFVRKDQIHISLRFLGSNVSEKSFEKLLAAFNELKFESFNVRIKEARFGFPGKRWPRILYVSLMKNEALDKFMRKFNEKIEVLELSDIQEERSGSPIYHFTVARVKTRLTENIVFDIRRKLEDVKLWEGFRVDKVVLVKSELFKEGPEYELVGRINLINNQ